MKFITEAASSPQVAVPLTSGVALSNMLQILPDIINVCTIVYLVLLISHKGYVMYKEWKGKQVIDNE